MILNIIKIGKKRLTIKDFFEIYSYHKKSENKL